MNGFYMSVVGVALVVLAALISAFFAWRFSKAFTATASYRAAIAFVVVIGVVIAMTWDVVLTSVKMAELCPQVGIFVKKSVNVDGFYTNFGSPDMLDRGFKYIETRSYGDRLVVYSRENSAVRKEEFDAKTYQVKSQYEFIYDAESGAFQGRKDIGIQKSVVWDRKNKDELGYSLRYTAYPGWVDQHTLGRLDRIQWSCDEGGAQNIRMMEKVLLPM